MLTALEVFTQHDGSVTKSYYEHLERLGPQGHIACCLFRAQKRSSRAKDYRRGKYRQSSYDVKQWSIRELCKALQEHGIGLGLRWGWKPDSAVLLDGHATWVLYVELPQGQVSFHSPTRETGPDYDGGWDGVRNASAPRIMAARPMHPDWVRDVRNQCAAAAVAFFFKQWGEWTPGENVDAVKGTVKTAHWFNEHWSFGTENLARTDDHVDDQPDLYCVGRKKAGASIDGREWREFPV